MRAVFLNMNHINYNESLLLISCMFWLQPTSMTLNHPPPTLTTRQTSGLFSVLHSSQSWHLLFPLPEIIFLLLFPQPGHPHPLGVCTDNTYSDRPSLVFSYLSDHFLCLFHGTIFSYVSEGFDFIHYHYEWNRTQVACGQESKPNHGLVEFLGSNLGSTPLLSLHLWVSN